MLKCECQKSLFAPVSQDHADACLEASKHLRKILGGTLGLEIDDGEVVLVLDMNDHHLELGRARVSPRYDNDPPYDHDA